MRIAAQVSDTKETYEAVASGIGVCLLAAGNAPIFDRGEVTMLPVRDLSPSELCRRRAHAERPGGAHPGTQVDTLAAVLGRPLRYEPVSERAGTRRDGRRTPAPYVDAFFRFSSGGEFDDSPVVDTVRRITGREPRRFEEWGERARTHSTGPG